MRPLLILALSFILSCGRHSVSAVARVNENTITLEDLNRTLPGSITAGEESTAVWKCLEELITKELFVQEAIRLGLDSAISYPLAMEKKGLVIQELFADVARQTKPITTQELQNAYKLLSQEVRCRLISVPDEPTSQRIYQQLLGGQPFETLATIYSIHPSRRNAGDLGFIAEYYIEEPLRSYISVLKPGQFTRPVFFDSSYQIVLLVERRPVNLPPFGEIKQQLEEQIKISRQRRAANEYVQKLRQRLIYNPVGLAIFYKPADAITEAEKEIWVAVRDSQKYIKVARLLHIARRFPPDLDTAIRTYAIKRAIEDDLMFEDGLNRSLDQTPKVAKQIEQRRRKLLYETLFNRMVASQIVVTDTDVNEYYLTHRDRYPGNDFNAVAGLIRNNLTIERRDARFKAYVAELRSRAKITINRAALQRVIANLKKNKKE